MTYLRSLNVSTKTFALVGAALLLLDFASTSIVSAATAATYLTGEVSSLPFPTWVGAIIVLALFTLISLTGVRESARITLAVFSLHVCVFVHIKPRLNAKYLKILSMIMLIIASSIHWREIGTGQIRANWNLWRANTSTSASGLAKQIFFGISLGMLGLTGFECTYLKY